MKGFLVSLALLAGAAGAAQSPTALVDSIDARSKAFFESSKTPGLAVGVWKDGAVVYSKGFGVAVVGGALVTPRTIFHTASISKTVVASAVMQLVQAGKVRLDDPVTTYVPYFTLKDPRSTSITVRQLLTHTAGMPDVDDYEWNKPRYDDQALERWIRGLKDSTMRWAPGQSWAYSNIGFELLADLVAIVSKQPFESYVQSAIFRPAGMRHSTFLMTDVDSANLSTGYQVGRDGVKNLGFPYNRRHAGSSTFNSNVEDMLRYGAMHAGRGVIDGKRVIPAAAYDSMWTAQRDITSNFAMVRMMTRGLAHPLSGVEMGLGWFIMDLAGRRVLNHDGEDDGYSSSLFISPDQRTVVVVLANSEANPELLAFALIDGLLR